MVYKDLIIKWSKKVFWSLSSTNSWKSSISLGATTTEKYRKTSAKGSTIEQQKKTTLIKTSQLTPEKKICSRGRTVFFFRGEANHMHPPTVDLRQSCTTQFGSAYLKNREITGYTTPAKFHSSPPKKCCFFKCLEDNPFWGGLASGRPVKIRSKHPNLNYL